MKVSYWAPAPYQDSGELSVRLSIAFLPRDPEEESVYPLAPMAGWSRVCPRAETLGLFQACVYAWEAKQASCRLAETGSL